MFIATTPFAHSSNLTVENRSDLDYKNVVIAPVNFAASYGRFDTDENKTECFNVLTVDLSENNIPFDIKSICLTACTYLKMEFMNYGSKNANKMDEKIHKFITDIKASLAQNPTKIKVGIFIIDTKSNLAHSYEVKA